MDAGRAGRHRRRNFDLALVAEAEDERSCCRRRCRRISAQNKNWREALALISQPKPFVIAVSDTARTYLEERFQFHAPERTTEEFLRELAGTKLLLPEQKESLGDFLASCDLVKFAKYEPGENELRELHGSALRLVEETEPADSGSGGEPTGDNGSGNDQLKKS